VARSGIDGTLISTHPAQFGSADPWDAYLTSIENQQPAIEALGVTDYYLTVTYEEVLQRKATGRLAGAKLIFPNVELRLDVAAKSGFVNIHLLVSPEDPDHLVEVKRLLRRLRFSAFNDSFDCTRDELIKLGRRANPSGGLESAAIRKAVCDILEGGEAAFRERARRLRVRLDR